MEQEQQSAASKSENTLLDNRTIFVSEGINAKGRIRSIAYYFLTQMIHQSQFTCI